jgi:soluble lytic murein transglycosylase
MGDDARQDSRPGCTGKPAPCWPRPNEAERAEARQLLQGIAGVRGFYEQLALEELGQRITVPPAARATDRRGKGSRANPGLNRALYAIALGLRSEGVREWNYTTNLHTPAA